MSAILCACCLKSGRIVAELSLMQNFYSTLWNTATRRCKNFNSYGIQRYAYCTKANAPPDVLKSRANEFRGKLSRVFEREDVQTILKRMTGVDIDKIYKTRRESLSKPKYKLADNEQLKKNESKIRADAEKRLKMPPVREMRKRIDVIISHDKDLIENDDKRANYVFTDISTSVDDEANRAVLVRENSTGILREATWDERDRMQFMYWPKEGQMYDIAPMLLSKNLPVAFDQLRHEDVLDLINIQFEVDAPDYIRVSHLTYEDLAEREAFDVLESTRYYGGMMFYYVNKKKTTTIFASFIRNGRVSSAADIARLHSLIHSDFKCNDDARDEDVIRKFIDHNGLDYLAEYLDHSTESLKEKRME